MTAARTTAAQPAATGNRAELIMGIAIITLVFAAIMAWVGWSIRTKQHEMETQISERLELLATSRKAVLESWLESLAQQTDRLISADLFRLYATDLDLIDADPSFLVTGIIPAGDKHDQMAQLAEQFPLMTQTFADFSAFSGFLSGRIVHRSGLSYIGSDAHLGPLTPLQVALIKQTFARPEVHFSTFRQTDNGLVIDMAVPILSTATDTAQAKAVAVVLLTKSATTTVTTLLSNTPLSAKGERTRVMQQTNSTAQEIVPWNPSGLVPLAMPTELHSSENLPFAERRDLSGQNDVFSLGLRLPGNDIWMVQEVDTGDATRALQEYKRISILIAGLIALVVSLIFGLFWWRTVGRAQQRVAARFRVMAEELERQHHFLDSINASIPDFVTVKDLNGAYTYANPALARAVGRGQNEVPGMDDMALFGFDTGKRLELSDERALKSNTPVTIVERIFLQSRLHHFQITKVPLKNTDNMPQGIVSVFRDITAMIEAEERKRLAISQTVEALVKAIEFTDPYLAGHSVLMRDVSSLLADTLHLAPEEKATVEIASHLSQIGKIFIDKAILTKVDQLTEDEKHLVQKHVDHAADILRQIDFELPVYEAVYQMHERLDGSGYPQGLSAKDIGIQARVLSVANSFCAMIKPRSYRPAISAREALATLRSSGESYDSHIVDALQAALETARGSKLLEQAGV